ncbi:FAD-dependent oxidoreductase [Saccharopolyspora sp. NPDC050389]|uniref:NAD(P)/FAD-dependent oxidoreductase n=1 Tax=Saccharopolyspora sp. NPDC050389 TaxID=3155516 RepID=UPI0033D8C9A0
MRGPARVVIVGASAAGLTAAETLRREGHRGRITMIGAESHLPYDRPPLSKQILAGDWEPERLALRDESAYQQLDLDIRRGTAAAELDVRTKTVTLRGGEALGYDGLIIATGVRPRRPAPLANAHVLHTLDDALALRSELKRAARIVIIGAGFVGTEAAAAARKLGVEVTLVDPCPVPMARQFGEQIGKLVAAWHRDHGVDLRMNAEVVGLLDGASESGVELADGTVLEADAVLAAVGATPATDWLSGSGLTVDDGVVCDATCQAAPDVYAAGDVAKWFNPRFRALMRVEHRMNATEQAMAAARNLLGAARPFDPIPYFWTDQFDAKIQAHGHFPPGSDITITHGEASERKFIATCTQNGRTTGVLGWNMPRQLRQARALVEEATVHLGDHAR